MAEDGLQEAMVVAIPLERASFMQPDEFPANTILGNSVSDCSTQRIYRTGRLPIAKCPFAERM
jgi:hypothetical protein